MKKIIVILLKKSEALSALSIRLVKLTGKNKNAIHPKHLVKKKVWYEKHLSLKDTVLDVGAGSCQDSIKIADKVTKIVCFEINMNMLNAAKKTIAKIGKKNIRLVQGDANKKLPFKNSSFDKVVCSDVLEHLEQRNFAIDEIKRVLKKRGLLFLVTDNPNTSWKKLQKSVGIFYYADREHKYEYPKEEILSKLKAKQFKIISVESVTYDTPFKGLVDITGGISLSVYKYLSKWKQRMVKLFPEETTSYKIVAQKI